MKFLFYIMCISFLFFSCQQRNSTIVEDKEEPKVIIEQSQIDSDSIFCIAIQNYILKESASGKWAVKYEDGFQRIVPVDYYIDFDFEDALKEVHYLAKDKSNPFSKIEIDYYLMKKETDAIQLIEDFKIANHMDNIGDFAFTRGRVIGKIHMKTPTLLYRKGATIFHIRTANGVAHIVSKALADFEKQENIDENDMAP